MLLSFRHGVSPGAKKRGEVMWPSPPPSFSTPLFVIETSACLSSLLMCFLFICDLPLIRVSSDSQTPPLIRAPKENYPNLIGLTQCNISDGKSIEPTGCSRPEVLCVGQFNWTRYQEVIDRTASRSTQCGLRKISSGRSEEATWPPPPHSTKTISSSSRPPSWPASSLLLSSLP